jgi:hypothetical protein
VLNDLLTIIRWHNMEIDFAGEVVRHEARQSCTIITCPAGTIELTAWRRHAACPLQRSPADVILDVLANGASQVRST